MRNRSDSPINRIVPWSNAIVFVMLHLVLVKGMDAVFSSFIATLVGVTLGIGGYLIWRFRPHIARDARVGPVLGLLTVLSYNILRFYAVPPPPPPPMQVTHNPDGSWRLNRGGGQLVGARYIVLPSDEEAASSPRQIGVVHVVDCYGTEECKVEFEGLRKAFDGRESYMVRPLRPKEWVPPYKELTSLVEIPAAGQGVLDMGSRLEVAVGDVYALFGPGMQGSHGYVVIEQVEVSRATGRLVQVSKLPTLPANLERIGTLKRVMDKHFTNAEIAFIGGNKESASRLYQLVFDLSDGKDERSRKRLEELKGVAAVTPSALSGLPSATAPAPDAGQGAGPASP